MTTLTITVPTPDALNSNQRLHHMVRAQKTAAIRHRAKYLLQARPAAERRMWPIDPVHVRATFNFADRRRRDTPNFWPSLKAAIDGCVDAGLLSDDSDDEIHSYLFERGDQVRKGLIQITITFTKAGGAK